MKQMMDCASPNAAAQMILLDLEPEEAQIIQVDMKQMIDCASPNAVTQVI